MIFFRRECPVQKAAAELTKAANSLMVVASATADELRVNGHKIKEAVRDNKTAH